MHLKGNREDIFTGLMIKVNELMLVKYRDVFYDMYRQKFTDKTLSANHKFMLKLCI
jgi:hypothetical protein